MQRISPQVIATVLDEPAIGQESIEFLNEGGHANDVNARIRVGTGFQDLNVGNLARGASAVIGLGRPVPTTIECVWSAHDAKGRVYVWTYDGRHERHRKGFALDLDEALQRLYPRG